MPASPALLTPHEIKNHKTQMTVTYLPRHVRPASALVHYCSTMFLPGLGCGVVFLPASVRLTGINVESSRNLTLRFLTSSRLPRLLFSSPWLRVSSCDEAGLALMCLVEEVATGKPRLCATGRLLLAVLVGGLLLIRPHASHAFAIGKATTTCSVVSTCRPDK